MVHLASFCLLLVPITALISQCFARWMRRAILGQRIREEGPSLHRKKSGTPTMGGGIILVLWGICLPILDWFGLLSFEGLFVFIAGLSFGAVGLLDDLVSLRFQRSLGLTPFQKVLLATAVSVVLFFAFPSIGRIPLRVPFTSISLSLSSGAFFFLSWVVFLATTNGMNLTDGLDGLATGVTVLILCGYLIIASAQTLGCVILPLVAILVGFLWMNAHPASLFLGDVGSFALGGVVAALALASGTALVLPLLAGLLVLELGSVILQVGCFKLTGKRIFKMSPLHHHFEQTLGISHLHYLPAAEWPEPKVVFRFWIVQGIFVGLGILATHF